MQVASKVGNSQSEFRYARPLDSQVIRYLHDGQMAGQTDGGTKATLTALFPTGGAIIITHI